MFVKVKFMGSMDTVDDEGPKREVLRLLRSNLVKSLGVFQETGVAGRHVLTQNAEKLINHKYCVAGRAFAFSLVFGGDPPSVLPSSVYNYITVGYERTTASVDEAPLCLIWRHLE